MAVAVFCIKRQKAGIAYNNTPHQSYGTSLAIWDHAVHAVLPATRHKWTRPA